MKKLLSALLLAAVTAVGAAENLLSISVGDLYSTGSGNEKVDTPDAIDAALKKWSKIYECPIVLWRTNDFMQDEYIYNKASQYISWCWAKEKEMRSQYNPATVSRAVCDRYGLKLYLNISFNDHGWPNYVEDCRVYWAWQNKRMISNPEYQDSDRDGKYHWGYLDLSNPEARKYMIDIIMRYMNSHKADGLYLNSRSHSNIYFREKRYTPGLLHADRFGFAPGIVAEYQKRYSIDIKTDPRFDYRSPEFSSDSVEVANWRKLRGEYYEIFYKEVKPALGTRQLLLSLPAGDYMGSSGGNIYVDHAKIIREKMADGIVFGTASGFVPKGSQRKMGFLSSEASDDNYNVPDCDGYLKKYGDLAVKNGVKLWSRDNVYDKLEAKKIDADPRWSGIMVTALSFASRLYWLDHPAFRPEKSSLTVSGWFFIRNDAGRLVSKYMHPEGRGWELTYEPKAKKSPESLLSFRCQIRNFGGRSADTNVVSTVVIPKNEWVHLAGVYDAEKSEMRVYINGKNVGSKKLEKHIGLQSNPGIYMAVGSYGGMAGGGSMDGLVDTLHIGTVAQDFTDGKLEFTGKEPGTIFYCQFDGKVQALTAPDGAEYDNIGDLKFSPGRNGRQALDFSAN